MGRARFCDSYTSTRRMPAHRSLLGHAAPLRLTKKNVFAQHSSSDSRAARLPKAGHSVACLPPDTVSHAARRARREGGAPPLPEGPCASRVLHGAPRTSPTPARTALDLLRCTAAARELAAPRRWARRPARAASASSGPASTSRTWARSSAARASSSRPPSPSGPETWRAAAAGQRRR